MGLIADWQTTGFMVLMIVIAFVVLWIARMIWRFLHDEIEPEPGGSFGSQFLARHDRAKKPEDWLKH